MLTAGLVLNIFGSVILIIFGIGFRGDYPVVPVGKSWWKPLSMEGMQRLGFAVLTTGFALQLVAQLLSCG